MPENFVTALLRQLDAYCDLNSLASPKLMYIADQLIAKKGTMELINEEMVADAEEAVMLLIRSLSKAKKGDLRHCRKGVYPAEPGSILNAYRDGDLDFTKCVEMLASIPPKHEPERSYDDITRHLADVERRIRDKTEELLSERNKVWNEFNTKYMQGFTIQGSDGVLLCDIHGYVVERRAFNKGYADIQLFNVSEFQQRYGRNIRCLDILLIGYWDKDGHYTPPDEDARKRADENIATLRRE